MEQNAKVGAKGEADRRCTGAYVCDQANDPAYDMHPCCPVGGAWGLIRSHTPALRAAEVVVRAHVEVGTVSAPIGYIGAKAQELGALLKGRVAL